MVQSTADAEFVASATTILEANCIIHIMNKIGIETEIPKLYNVHQSTLHNIREGDTYRLGEQHVGVRYFWLRDAIQNNELTIAYCLTANMIADTLTKQNSHVKLDEFCRKLRMV